MSNIDKQALREVAERATALNLDTAQVKRGNDGYLECPSCEGAGYVEEENDFCNIDGVALGVQFYGIGEHHGLAELYLRAASPATVLALLDELEAAEKQIAELEARDIQPLGVQLITEAIGAHGYIVGCLQQNRPDLALEESLKWVQGISQAAVMATEGE